MANRGNSRAPDGARAGNAYAQEGEDDYFDEPAGGVGEGRGEAGQDGEDAALDAGAEQTPGGQDDIDPDFPDEDPDADPEPQPRRAANRIQTLSRQLAEEKRAREEMQARLDRVAPREQPAARGAPAAFAPVNWEILRESDADFNTRVRQLPLEDQMEQRQTRSEAKAEARAQISQFNATQAQDKANYDALCATDPIAKKWAFKVEQERERLIREQGQYVSREVILDHMYGKFKRTGGRDETRQAQRRVEAARTRPGSPRGDVGGGGRAPKDERQKRASRLEGINI